MAKAQLKVVSQKKEAPVKVSIKTREEADRVLKEIGIAEDRISAAEAKEEKTIRGAKTSAIDTTASDRKLVKAQIKELERWASNEGKGLFKGKKRSLDLNFGTVGFRLTPWAVELVLKAAHVIERLRAKKMKTCIRTGKETVDKDALQAYDDKVLEKVGCKRTQKDEFFFEVKKDGVKG